LATAKILIVLASAMSLFPTVSSADTPLNHCQFNSLFGDSSSTNVSRETLPDNRISMFHVKHPPGEKTKSKGVSRETSAAPTVPVISLFHVKHRRVAAGFRSSLTSASSVSFRSGDRESGIASPPCFT
jgi:hypothetical protein